MKESQYEQMDRLLRVLFYEGTQAWYHVYSKAQVPKDEADFLYQTLKAEGRIKIDNKGDDFSIPDPHHVTLTAAGRAWFSHNSYVETYAERPINPPAGPIININNSKVSNLNAQSGSTNVIQAPDDKITKGNKSFWKSNLFISTLSGVIILILTLILKHYFKLG